MPEIWTVVALASALVASNACWLFAFRHYQTVNLEINKLIASRTLSEYAWLKKTEQPQPEKKPEEGYSSVFEEEDKYG